MKKFNAKSEAISVHNDNKRINDAEHAYSPSFNTVGMRWENEPFRVFNVGYPFYKESKDSNHTLINDWVSVGKGRAK